MPHLRSSLLVLVALCSLGVAFAVSSTAEAGIETGSIPDTDDNIYFQPSIYFPGLERMEGVQTLIDSKGNVSYRMNVTPTTLGEYIVALYKFFTGATAILAMFMVTYGGLLWLLAGGNQGSITNAKEVITGAIAGMVIALLSYALLATISSGLVEFKSLDTRLEAPLGSGVGALGAEVTCESSGMHSLSLYQNIRVAPLSEGSHPCLRGEAIEGLIAAGLGLTRNPQPISQLKVTSALRSRTFQEGLYKKNCFDRVCTEAHPDDWLQECTPRACNPPTCNPYQGPCPHTEGNAVDVFCDNGEHTGACQLKLENLMLDNSFCRLKSEAWHFEKPKISATCLNSYPDANGARADCTDNNCCNARTGENCATPSN